VNPLVADYHILLAESLDKRGDFRSAIESTQRTLILSPRRARPSNYLGNLGFRSGDYSCAADNYRAASELEPDNRFYRMNLESALRRLAPYESKE
jgi:tetratricopeptide (TPR) repeat protein